MTPKIGARIHDSRRGLTGEIVNVTRQHVVCRRDDGRRWFARRRDLKPPGFPFILAYQFRRKESA